MLYQRVTLARFIDTFRQINRDNFSYEGYRVLYEFLDAGEDVDFAPVAIDCEWVQSTIDDALVDYNLESLDELEDNTMVLRVNKTEILYIAF